MMTTLTTRAAFARQATEAPAVLDGQEATATLQPPMGGPAFTVRGPLRVTRDQNRPGQYAIALLHGGMPLLSYPIFDTLNNNLMDPSVLTVSVTKR